MRPMLVSCPRFWAKVRGYELHRRFITYMSLNQDSKCDANCQGCFRILGEGRDWKICSGEPIMCD